MDSEVQELLGLSAQYTGKEIACAWDGLSEKLGNTEKKFLNIADLASIAPREVTDVSIDDTNRRYVLILREGKFTLGVYVGNELFGRIGEHRLSSMTVEDDEAYNYLGVGDADPMKKGYTLVEKEEIYGKIKITRGALEFELKKLCREQNSEKPKSIEPYKKTQRLDPYVVRAAAAFKQNSRSTGQIQRTEKRA